MNGLRIMNIKSTESMLEFHTLRPSCKIYRPSQPQLLQNSIRKGLNFQVQPLSQLQASNFEPIDNSVHPGIQLAAYH